MRILMVVFLVLVAAWLTSCAEQGPWRKLEGAGIGGAGGAALAGAVFGGPVGAAAGAVAGSGVGALIASKTERATERVARTARRESHFVPVFFGGGRWRWLPADSSYVTSRR